MADLPGQIKSALDLVNNTTTLEMENKSAERLPIFTRVVAATTYGLLTTEESISIGLSPSEDNC